MYENFPISLFVYDSPLYYIAAGKTLNSNKTKFKNIFVDLSVPQMEFLKEKKEVKTLVILSL